MIFTTLDIITRRGLLENNLPIHYYSEFLIHGSSALRELTFDTLKVINTVKLPISTYGSCDLPDDFVEDVGVFFDDGGTLSPIAHNNGISPLRLHDTTSGAFVPPTGSDNTQQDSSLFFGSSGSLWFWNVNDFGEPTGRYFGANGGTNIGYKVIKERRQIQLSSGFIDGAIVLQYISDGQSIDSATQIDTQAIATIRAYQEWKRSPNANNEFSPEGRGYYNQKRLLRARLNDLSLHDIKNIIRKNYTAAIKN